MQKRLVDIGNRLKINGVFGLDTRPGLQGQMNYSENPKLYFIRKGKTLHLTKDRDAQNISNSVTGINLQPAALICGLTRPLRLNRRKGN